MNKRKSLLDSETNSSPDPWRILQIMSEFVQGCERLAHIAPAVTIFGSARFEPGHRYCQFAEQLAQELSDAGFAVMTGGGPGIMAAANKGAFTAKSPSVGLNINLPQEQHTNMYQDISLNFQQLSVRKTMLITYASAYVVLPGGWGTLDELAEVLVLVQTGKIPPVPIILVDSSFWQGLLAWFTEQMVVQGTIHPDDIELLTVADDVKTVVDTIFNFYEHHPVLSNSVVNSLG